MMHSDTAWSCHLTNQLVLVLELCLGPVNVTAVLGFHLPSALHLRVDTEHVRGLRGGEG